MIGLGLAEIAAAVGGTLDAGADPGARVTGRARTDSRAVEPGDLFLALPGERADGHDFASAATQNGAVAVLAARPVGVPAILVADPLVAVGKLARAVRDTLAGTLVVGITGSSGKTSTKDLLRAVLSAAGPTHAPQNSFNNELGVPLTVLDAPAGTRNLIVEMGARGIGHIGYLCSIAAPTVGVVLNIGTAHVGEFGSRETTALAKGELVESLPAGGVAVLNADDPLVAAMAARTQARVVRTGIREPADVRAVDVVLDEEARASFRLVTPRGEADVRLAAVGAHQVANALAAAAVGLEAGLTPEAIATALGQAPVTSRWRMETHRRDDGLLVINDAYNANPDSVNAALDALVALGGTGPDVRRVAVLGEMLELGAISRAEHEAVGRRVAGLGVDLIAVGAGAAPMVDGAGPGARAVDGVADAVAAVEELKPDVVLVKASRSVGLEEVAAELLRAGTVNGGNGGGTAHRSEAAR